MDRNMTNNYTRSEAAWMIKCLDDEAAWMIKGLDDEVTG